ncbi:ABC transporter ATP-binding protein [Ruegeria pomeroyi]|nr:ABC transporter ATP-binding protein [Ruegeria pomeroyi]
MNAPHLDIRGLTVDFTTPTGPVHALRDVSFAVPQNSVTGIVGESGSGKSTVLWSILGLLSANARVRRGEILFEGEDMLRKGTDALRAARGQDMSVVFQNPMASQIPVLTYATQMRDILYRKRDLSAADKRTLAVEMMERVGIPDPARRIDQYPHHFSGGMRQRAGIAMALLPRPRLLLADEPTTALDVTMEAQVIHLIRDLATELETTVLVVSHNLGLIAEMCDHVVVMYAGEVVEAGPVRELFHNARHPYTRALLDCDPARITRKTRHLPVIEGSLPDLSAPPKGCIFAARCPKATLHCEAEAPSAQVSGGRHSVRCHFPVTEKSVPDAPRILDAPHATPPDAGDIPLLEVPYLNVRFRTMGPIRARLNGVADPFVDAVLDVGLTVRRGETLGLVGESGSGKTTLGRAILNLTRASAGSVRFEGREVRNLPERAFKPLRRDMAMMFQDAIGSLSPRKTVRALIAEPFVIHGAQDRDLDREAERLADLVQLPRAFLGRYPHELSGGQARRVGVARALALNPKLIIADEPTAGLDVSVQGDILNLMAELQREKGLSYLLITHNLPVVRHVSDRLAIMYMGRIVETGEAEAIFNQPGHPYTEALVRGVPQPDPDQRRTAPPLRGEVPSLMNRPRGCDFAARCPFAKDECRQIKPSQSTRADGRVIACHFPLI